MSGPRRRFIDTVDEAQRCAGLFKVLGMEISQLGLHLSTLVPPVTSTSGGPYSPIWCEKSGEVLHGYASRSLMRDLLA